MQFYHLLYTVLKTSNIDEKEQLIRGALKMIDSGHKPSTAKEPDRILRPSYSRLCRIVAPKELPRRGDINSDNGMKALMHAVAHIEFSAIDLAVDAAYRFVDTPVDFAKDWLEVAADEVRHFRMLNSLLKRVGSCYGELPVHRGLFDASSNTMHSLLDRMAVVPRYFEASGLDVTPAMMQKVKESRHPISDDLLGTLKTIYHEEIEHVTKGDKWFTYACKRDGKSKDVYFEILKKYGLDKKRSNINVTARQKAGFSCKEIKRLGASC